MNQKIVTPKSSKPSASVKQVVEETRELRLTQKEFELLSRLISRIKNTEPREGLSKDIHFFFSLPEFMDLKSVESKLLSKQDVL